MFIIIHVIMNKGMYFLDQQFSKLNVLEFLIELVETWSLYSEFLILEH